MSMPSWRDHNDGSETTATTIANREVAAQIDVEVTAPSTLEFQIAVARLPGLEVRESLAITLDGKPLQPREIIGPHESRIHAIDVGTGAVSLSYQATVLGEANPAPVRDIDVITYLRPSRYAEADKFFGFAATEFGAVHRLGDAAGKGCRLGRGAPGLRAGVQRPDRRRRRHAACGRGSVPRLCPPGDRLTACGECAGSTGGGLRTRMRPDGLSRGSRGARRRRMARRRRDMPGSAAVDGAHRHRTRRRGHRVPGQPQRLDHA